MKNVVGRNYIPSFNIGFGAFSNSLSKPESVMATAAMPMITTVRAATEVNFLPLRARKGTNEKSGSRISEAGHDRHFPAAGILEGPAHPSR